MRTFSFIVASLILFILIFEAYIVNEMVRERLVLEVRKACETCELKVEKASVTFFPPGLSLSGVQFNQGDPAATAFSVKIQRIEIELQGAPIFSGILHLRHVQLFSPEFSVIEGDLPSPRSSEKAAGDRAVPRLTIEKTSIKNGKFSYTRVYADRKAQLFVKDFAGTIGAIKMVRGFEGLSTRAEVTGRLENSGDFRLQLDCPLFAERLMIDLDLKISEQNLQDISPFFEATGGVKIAGSLYFGRGHMKVRGRSIRGSVFAQYRNLSIEMQRTKERSGIMAFLSTLVASIKMDSSSIGEKALEQSREIRLQQRRTETTLQLILRGLRDASLQIATNADRKSADIDTSN